MQVQAEQRGRLQSLPTALATPSPHKGMRAYREVVEGRDVILPIAREVCMVPSRVVEPTEVPTRGEANIHPARRRHSHCKDDIERPTSVECGENNRLRSRLTMTTSIRKRRFGRG